MSFKRITAAVLAAALMVMVGCGEKKTDGAGSSDTAKASDTASVSSSDAVKKLDPIKVAEDMFAVMAPQGEMIVVEDSVLDNYYTIDKDIVTGQKIYISTSFIAEEIAVFGVKDGKAEDAKKMLEQRLADLKASFDGYLPEELASLEANAKILTNGNLICFMTGEGDGFAEAEKVFISL